ncbi:dharma [Anguilla anguilla]|uniref:dharma n=1 Tax=Anguilla anguilla TaxID=7936 RepID=UPI0015B1AEE4|nr:dharma [Anguilla anguilla]
MLYDYCRNDHFGYAPFNYYPLDFGQGSFQNGAGPQTQYVGLYPPTVNNPRKRNRMRTVFTETQAQKLEHLFGVTDYPAAEAREELAVKAGLSAETVRVWFKNRRARRRRQGIAKGRTLAHAKGAKRDSPGSNK